MYKFIRINDGPLRGAYHHPFFERNRFDLIEKVNRKDRDSTTSKGKEDIFGSAEKLSKSGSTKRQLRNTKKQERQGLHGVPTAAAPIEMRRSLLLKDESSLSSSEAGGTEDDHHDDFELIDFDCDDAKPNLYTGKIGPGEQGKPALPVPSMVERRTINHGSQSLRATFCEMKGVFDLQPEIEAPVLPSSKMLQTKKSFPQIHSPSYLSNVPEDITQEIIKTFGSYSSYS